MYELIPKAIPIASGQKHSLVVFLTDTLNVNVSSDTICSTLKLIPFISPKY